MYNMPYTEECKLTMKNFIRSAKKELKENIRNWDTEEWLKEVKQKQSLYIYKSWKNEIQEEVVGLYDNTY